jgi:hypothetical protein
MKKLLLIFAFIAGFTQAQAQAKLGITSITSFTYYTVGSQVYMTFYSLEVKNYDSLSTFNDSLFFGLALVDTPFVITPIATAADTIYTIFPNDSILIDSTQFVVDSSMLKDGNNTVVIWPYGPSWKPNVTKDTAALVLFIDLPSATRVNNIDAEFQLSIGPNPSGRYIALFDNENILQSVQMRTIEGKYVNIPINGKLIDVSAINEGIYLLEMRTTKGTVTQKIIVKR